MAFNLEDYEPVAHRLDRWLKDCHVRGVQPKVITDLVHYLNDKCVFSASLYENDTLISTGWAEEIRGEGHINKASHLENCETGSVGRALANAGYAGSDLNKRPSREEMAKVQNAGPKMRITQASSAKTDGVTVKGNQFGAIPDWLIAEAAQAGVSQVWDNRDKVAGTKRPWFKDVNGDKAFWPPRGTPDPIVATHEDDLSEFLTDEEPF